MLSLSEWPKEITLSGFYGRLTKIDLFKLLSKFTNKRVIKAYKQSVASRRAREQATAILIKLKISIGKSGWPRMSLCVGDRKTL